MSRLDCLLVVHGFNFFTAPDDFWCGGVRDGGLSERLVREVSTYASQ